MKRLGCNISWQTRSLRMADKCNFKSTILVTTLHRLTQDAEPYILNNSELDATKSNHTFYNSSVTTTTTCINHCHVYHNASASINHTQQSPLRSAEK
jgi:hypothetical protein